MGWTWNHKQTVQDGNTQIELEFVSEGFRAILLGDGVKSLVESVTNDIQQRCGDGFEADVFVGGYGGGRWVGAVSTTDRASKVAEAEDKVLERAIGK